MANTATPPRRTTAVAAAPHSGGAAANPSTDRIQASKTPEKVRVTLGEVLKEKNTTINMLRNQLATWERLGSTLRSTSYAASSSPSFNGLAGDDVEGILSHADVQQLLAARGAGDGLFGEDASVVTARHVSGGDPVLDDVGERGPRYATPERVPVREASQEMRQSPQRVGYTSPEGVPAPHPTAVPVWNDSPTTREVFAAPAADEHTTPDAGRRMSPPRSPALQHTTPPVRPGALPAHAGEISVESIAALKELLQDKTARLHADTPPRGTALITARDAAHAEAPDDAELLRRVLTEKDKTIVDLRKRLTRLERDRDAAVDHEREAASAALAEKDATIALLRQHVIQLETRFATTASGSIVADDDAAPGSHLAREALQHALHEREEANEALKEQLRRAETIGKQETEKALQVSEGLLDQLRQRERLCEAIRDQVAGLERQNVTLLEEVNLGKAQGREWELERETLVEAHDTLRANVEVMVKRLEEQFEEEVQSREQERKAWLDRVDDLSRQLKALQARASPTPAMRSASPARPATRVAHQSPHRGPPCPPLPLSASRPFSATPPRASPAAVSGDKSPQTSPVRKRPQQDAADDHASVNNTLNNLQQSHASPGAAVCVEAPRAASQGTRTSSPPRDILRQVAQDQSVLTRLEDHLATLSLSSMDSARAAEANRLKQLIMTKRLQLQRMSTMAHVSVALGGGN